MIKPVLTYKKSPKMLQKEFRPILKGELRQVGLMWHREMMPEHFKVGAERKYDYEKRSKSHIMRKIRRFGHRRPLEYTGKSKRMAKREARLTGTSKRVRVRLRVPKYFYQRRGKAPDKAKELTSLTQREADMLAGALKKKMSTRMAGIFGRQTVRA